MNVELLTMEREDAKRMLREYRRELAREHTAELAAVEQGLQAVARGKRVLHLSNAIVSGGFDERGRPHIAACRADRTRVRLYMPPTGTMLRFTAQTDQRFGRRPLNDQIIATRAVEHSFENRSWQEWDAMVPLVPPAALAASGLRSRGALGRCIVMWEVERWVQADRKTNPDADPYLLRHVGGELYEILAEWDLTTLERAIMQGARR